MRPLQYLRIFMDLAGTRTRGFFSVMYKMVEKKLKEVSIAYRKSRYYLAV